MKPTSAALALVSRSIEAWQFETEIEKASEVAISLNEIIDQILAAPSAANRTRYHGRGERVDEAIRALVLHLGLNYLDVFKELPSPAKLGVFFNIIKAIFDVARINVSVGEKKLASLLDPLQGLGPAPNRGRKKRQRTEGLLNFLLFDRRLGPGYIRRDERD
jgi:hypothetical protein